jgi:hypothetical protein
MTQRNINDFLTDFNKLLQYENDYNRDHDYSILINLYMDRDGAKFSLKDATQFINNIENIRQMKTQIPILKSYLQKNLKYLISHTSRFRGNDPNFDPDEVELYNTEKKMWYLIRNLLIDLKNPATMGLQTSTEQMALKSIERQTNIPEDVVKYEIGSFVGKGGKRRTKKIHAKRKRTRKHNKRRRTRRYKR